MILGEVQVLISRMTDDKKFTEINERIEELKSMMLSEIDAQLKPDSDSIVLNAPYNI